MVEGFKRREEREWERVAWLASHVINMAGKSLKKGTRVTPAKLLGRKRPVRTRKGPGDDE